MNTPNSISVEPIGLGEWWYGDVNNFLFDSAKSAIEIIGAKSLIM